MRRFCFLLFLALSRKAYGHRGSHGLSTGAGESGSGSFSFGTGDSGAAVTALGGVSALGGGGSLSRAEYPAVSSSSGAYEDFAGGWPGHGYYGGLGAAAGFNSGPGGVSGSIVDAGGLGTSGGFNGGSSEASEYNAGSGVQPTVGSFGSNAAPGNVGFSGSGGSRAVTAPEGALGGAVGLRTAVGTGSVVPGVGSGGNAGTYGGSLGVGSLGGGIGGTMGAYNRGHTGLRSGSVGSARGGIGGSSLQSINADLAARRRRARIVGAAVGTAVGGLLLGGLIGGLGHLRRTGRLHHSGYVSGFGSTGYERYGNGYGYSSRYRSGRFYRGYNSRCKTCLYQRRPCIGVQCN